MDWKRNSWVEYGEHLPEKPGSIVYFEQERIIVRRLVSRREELMACFTNEPFVNTKDIYNLLKRENIAYSLLYITALINSKLLAHVYLMSSTIARKDDFPQLTLDGLRNLPIRSIEFTTPAETRQRMLNEAIALYEQYLTGQNHDSLLKFSQDCLVTGQSDVVHDLLAHLAEQMMSQNQVKQRITKAFWLDLEGLTEQTIFEILCNKGKWEQTLAKQAACAPYVSADSRATRTLDESLAWSEEAFKCFLKLLQPKIKHLSQLVDIYHDHSLSYQQCSQRLEQTDRLIERLVYQLYELTEAEIAIVTQS
jgi:hypothetical protein